MWRFIDLSLGAPFPSVVLLLMRAHRLNLQVSFFLIRRAFVISGGACLEFSEDERVHSEMVILY